MAYFLTQTFVLVHTTIHSMMRSSNENISRVTDPLCGEFTGHRLCCALFYCVYIIIIYSNYRNRFSKYIYSVQIMSSNFIVTRLNGSHWKRSIRYITSHECQGVGSSSFFSIAYSSQVKRKIHNIGTLRWESTADQQIPCTNGQK